MDRLVDLVAPTVAVVLNASIGHTQFLGDSVAYEKSRIWSGDAPASTLVYDASDEALRALASRHPGRHLAFGVGAEADVRAESIRASADETSFDLVIGSERGSVRLTRPGLHHVSNAIAAASVAWALGCSLAEIVRRLSEPLPQLPSRAEPRSLPGDITVIQDSFSANLKSGLAFFELAALEREHRRPQRRIIAVLADMTDLGAQTEEAHVRLGQAAARAGIDVFITIGSASRASAAAAIAEGMPAGCVTSVDHVEDAAAAVVRSLRPRDTVMLKASGVMDRVVERLFGIRRDVASG